MVRIKIIFGMSLALALFYTVPWLTLADNGRLMQSTADGFFARRLTFLFVSVFMTALVFLAYNLVWKSHLKRRYKVSVFGSEAINVAVILMSAALINFIMIHYFPSEGSRSLFVHYFFRNTVIATFAILVGYSFDLITRLENVKTVVVTLEKQKLENEIEVLKSQMNPHFFFNSMSTLKVLIRENKLDAMEFVDRLSGTFRYFMEKREEDVVVIEEELVHLESYLFVIQKRFGSSFMFSIKLAEHEVKEKVLHFSLWTAVENVLKHNQLSLEKPLKIELRKTGSYISVRNSVNPKISQSNGVGLSNLSKRYWLRCGENVVVNHGEDYFEVLLPIL